MSDTNSSSRHNRHSVYKAAGSSSVLNILKARIKAASNKNSWNEDAFDPMNPGCIVHKEQIIVNKKIKNVRRVYMSEDHKYKTGWIVDADLDICMICFGGFGWLNLKHHCRACGFLVCGKCSPYNAVVPHLNEENGSRVCKNCHSLQAQGIGYGAHVPSNSNSPYTDRRSVASIPNTPISVANSVKKNNTPASVMSHSNNNSTFNTPQSTIANRRASAAAVGVSGGGVGRRSSSGMVMSVEELSRLEKQLEPRYREANEKMRQIIPLDLFKINYNQLLEYGVPPKIANRVWNNKILWMIVMHPDDIAKIHMADLRSKYIATGLDVLEMRAIWYNLPNWVTVSDAAVDSTGIVDQAKAEWKIGFKSRLDDLAYKESRNTLTGNLLRNEAYDGYDDLHLFNYELPLQRRFDNGASYAASGAVNESVSSVTGSNNDFRYDDGVGGKTKHYLDQASTASRTVVANNTQRSVAGGSVAGGSVVGGASTATTAAAAGKKKASATATIFNNDSEEEGDEISEIPIGHLDLDTDSDDGGSMIEDDLLERMSMGRGGGRDDNKDEEEYDPLDDIYNYKKPFKPSTTTGSVASKDVKPVSQMKSEIKQPQQQHLSMKTQPVNVAMDEPEDLEDEVNEEEEVYDANDDPLLEEGGYEYGRTSSVGSETTKLAAAYIEQQKMIEMQAAQIEEMKRQQELQQALMFQQQQSQVLNSNTNRVLSRFYSEKSMAVPGGAPSQPYQQVPPQMYGAPQMSSSFNSTNGYMPLGQAGRSHSVAYMPSQPSPAMQSMHAGSGYVSPMHPGVGASGVPPPMPMLHPSMQSPTPLVDAYGMPVPHLHQQQASPFMMPPYNPAIRSGQSTPQQQFYHPPASGSQMMGQPHPGAPGHYAGAGSGGHNPYLIPSAPSLVSGTGTPGTIGTAGYYGENRYSPLPPQQHHHPVSINAMPQAPFNAGDITPPRNTVLMHRASLGALPSAHGSSHPQLLGSGGNSRSNSFNNNLGSTSKPLSASAKINIQAINEHVNKSFAGAQPIAVLDTASVAEKQLTPRSCLSVTSEADENTFTSNPAEVPHPAPSVSSASSLSGTVSVHSNNLSNVLQVNSPLAAVGAVPVPNPNDHLTVHHLASPKTSQGKSSGAAAKLNPPLTSSQPETGSSSSAVLKSSSSTTSELYPHLQVVNASTPMTVSSDASRVDPNASAAANIKSPPRKKLVHNNSLNSMPLPSTGTASNSAPSPVVVPQVSRQELHDRLIYGIQVGSMNQVTIALKMMNQERANDPHLTANAIVDSTEASQLLLSCYENSNDLQQPVEVLGLLVDQLRANINIQHPTTGNSVLHYAVEQGSRVLCASMLKRGSNILLNNSAGVTPLALSLNKGIDWLLEEFESCGKEAEFIRSADQLSLFQYATTLILSGYAVRAGRVIKEGRVTISPDDATELLSNCQGNFDNMKEPVETFELLDSLGAKL